MKIEYKILKFDDIVKSGYNNENNFLKKEMELYVGAVCIMSSQLQG